MSRFFKDLVIVVDVCFWIIFLVACYIFDDLWKFRVLFYSLLGGTLIFGALLLAIQIMGFLLNRRRN